jgi:hypothetical protein
MPAAAVNAASGGFQASRYSRSSWRCSSRRLANALETLERDGGGVRERAEAPVPADPQRGGRPQERRHVETGAAGLGGVESMQICGVHYAANAIASSSFTGRKPG